MKSFLATLRKGLRIKGGGNDDRRMFNESSSSSKKDGEFKTFAQAIREIRVQNLTNSSAGFREACCLKYSGSLSRETRRDVVTIATKLLTTRKFDVVDSLIMLNDSDTARDLCEDPRFSRALFVFSLSELERRDDAKKKKTRFLKLISILSIHKPNHVARLVLETEGMIESLIVSTSFTNPDAYDVLNAIDSNEFWRSENMPLILLDLIKGLIVLEKAPSIIQKASTGVIKIQCSALLQRAVMSIVSVSSNMKKRKRLQEWKEVLYTASHLFRKDPDSYPWFTILLCFISSSQQHRILIFSDLKLHIVLRAAYAGFYGKISKRTAEQCACALSMIGDKTPPTSLHLSVSRHRHRGVRILSIDGGGTRGIGSIETLRALQRACGGRPIYKMFDVICGTSTGGILAVSLGLLRRPLDEVEKMYRNFSSRVFESSSVYRGALTGGMYSASPLESIISNYTKKNYDIGTYGWHRRDCWNIEEDDDASTCRVFVVASAVGTTRKPKPFLFRNYNYPSGNGATTSRHPGTTSAPLWSCLRATTAAPGYFPEYNFQGEIFQDGAICANNPCGIAVHEARCLFPNRNIDCVVSIGTGQFITDMEPVSREPKSSLGLLNSVRSAIKMVVDTESVHFVLSDLLDTSSTCYVRLNPSITPVSLNEKRQDVLQNLQNEFKSWCQSDEAQNSIRTASRVL